MTLEETKKFLMMVNALYPNWRVDNPQETAAAWHWILSEYPVNVVMAGFEIFAKTGKSGFAPSAPQIIDCINKVADQEYLSEGEAWALVKRAIQDGYYHGQQRYDELPPIVQRAVGSANMIRQWADLPTEQVNSVIMSNFQRSYKALLERQTFNDKVPPALSEIIRGVADKTSGNKLTENG